MIIQIIPLNKLLSSGIPLCGKNQITQIISLRKNPRNLLGICVIIFFSALTVATMAFANKIALKYESKGKRDPFVPLVGSGKVVSVSAGLGDILSIDDVTLEGIAIGAGGKRVALINGQIMKEDERIGNLKIKKITDTKVTLSINDKVYNLNLPEEE